MLVVKTGPGRSSWPLARVVKVFKEVDATVMAAEVWTSAGRAFTRPVKKLVLLEGDH